MFVVRNPSEQCNERLIRQVSPREFLQPHVPTGEDYSEVISDIKNLITQQAERVSALETSLAELKPAGLSYVTLYADAWVGSDNHYTQVVDIKGVTEFSQVDLTPNAEQLKAFYEKDLTFVTENNKGVVTVHVIGQKPQNDYTIQVTITEVATTWKRKA